MRDKLSLRRLGFVLPTLPDPTADTNVTTDATPAEPASGPQKLLGDVPRNGDVLEPKPMLTQLEPKPDVEAPSQAEHHPEAPNTKRPKMNLQAGETIALPSDSQHTIETLLETVNMTIHLGAYTYYGFIQMSPHNQTRCDLLRVLNDSLRDQLGHRQFRWTSINIEYNIVTRPSIMTTYVGPSVHLLMGNFTGGTFRTVDNIW